MFLLILSPKIHWQQHHYKHSTNRAINVFINAPQFNFLFDQANQAYAILRPLFQQHTFGSKGQTHKVNIRSISNHASLCALRNHSLPHLRWFKFFVQPGNSLIHASILDKKMDEVLTMVSTKLLFFYLIISQYHLGLHICMNDLCFASPKAILPFEVNNTEQSKIARCFVRLLEVQRFQVTFDVSHSIKTTDFFVLLLWDSIIHKQIVKWRHVYRTKMTQFLFGKNTIS